MTLLFYVFIMKKLSPPRNDFLDAVRRDEIVPLHCELSAGGLSPLGVLEVLRPLGFPALLESARVNEKTGRYSFVTADPYLIMSSRGTAVTLRLPAAPPGKFGSRATMQRPPLEKLREVLVNYRTAAVDGLPPFTGGAVGFFSYDFVRHFEDIPKRAVDDLSIPECSFLFVDLVVAFDHVLDKTWIIVNPGAREQELGFRKPRPEDWGRLYDEAAARLATVARRIEEAAATGRPASPASSRDEHRAVRVFRSTLTKELFEDMVRRCREYIAAGDIYQANLSLRMSADIGDADPLRLYRLLREINPSPFAAYLDFGDLQLVSSSPERLVRLRNGIADTRPIAGTRPRGESDAETAALSDELLVNEKERAEHVMLIDLERNDLGRVCDFGSVTVDELMVIEEYSHVIHIVSNVSGRISAGKDCFDLVRAVFPGGTITGVPKVRCMEIIDELEPVARGPYTGSLGYISNSGDLDLNIIIRTIVVKDAVAHVQAGAGIVADSDPEREYVESLRKAEAMKKAVEML
jgi:anthranilate/para-aminobenzoate synthase component I